MNNLVLHCENVSKSIGRKKILDNINLDIYEKDVIGLIGLNGVGKTTLIKAILSLQKIDTGNIYINNYDIKCKFTNAILGVGAVVETPIFYNNLTGMENLKLKKRMYKNITDDRINEIIKLVGLKDRIKDKVSKYSLGMKERLGIAIALLNNPKLLILDEPTNGLDPEGIKDLKDIIHTLSNNGTSILISSHILSELESICNKVCIMKNGKILETDDINKIKNRNSSYLFEVSDTENINLLFKNKILEDNKFKVWCNKEFIPLIVESLTKSDIKIYSIKKEEMSLEDIFLERSSND